MRQMAKATDIHQIIGTMEGHRGVVFHFTMKNGPAKSVAFDFYGNGRQFNGAEYRRIESAALASMIAGGFTAEHIETYTHYLLPL
jgi:hypothetical protein